MQLTPSRNQWLQTLTILFGFCVFGISCSNWVLAQTELPTKVQADLLLNKILAAAKDRDLREVLALIDQLKALKVDVPPAVVLVEAKAAHTTGDPLRAFRALQAYLGVSHDDSKGYKEAVALYPVYQKEAAPLLQKEKDKKEQEEADRRKSDQERTANEAAHRMELEHLKAEAEAHGKDVEQEVEGQLVPIPATRCRLGEIEPKGQRNWPEAARTVAMPAFSLQKLPVTWAQYRIFAHATGITVDTSAPPLHPAYVSFEKARAYVSWLSQQSRRRFRLPTADELECAARDGAWPNFAFAATDGPLYGYAKRVGKDDAFGTENPVDVGKYLPSKLGIYDLWTTVEWTNTCDHFHSPEVGECSPAGIGGPPGDFDNYVGRMGFNPYYSLPFRVASD